MGRLGQLGTERCPGCHNCSSIAAILFPAFLRGDVDFAFGFDHLARIRGSVYAQRGSTTLALRMIPSRIPVMEELGLPEVHLVIATLHTNDTTEGMQTLEMQLSQFVTEGIVERDEAAHRSLYPKEIARPPAAVPVGV